MRQLPAEAGVWSTVGRVPLAADNSMARESGTIPRFTTERGGGGGAMIPHLLFLPVGGLGLLWLFVMLHAAWPRPMRDSTGNVSHAHHTAGSCIQPLRIIHSPPKPATLSPPPSSAGALLWYQPSCLPTRSRGAGVRLPDALLAMAPTTLLPLTSQSCHPNHPDANAPPRPHRLLA